MKINNVKFVRSVAVACTTVAMLLVGCNEPDVITPTPEPEPEPTPEPDVEMVVLKASTESTRTHLNEEYEVIWNEGDAITVFGSTDNYASSNEETFAMKDGANTSTATFEGYLPEATEGSALYATYPDCWESPTEVAFPYEQRYVAGTFANNCCPMIAKFTAAQTNISFRNPFGIIELNLTGNVTVSSVTLSDAGYDLTDVAPATFTIDPETLALTGGSVNAAVITLKDINLSLTETAQSLFVIVPPATYTALKVDVTCSDGTVVSRTAENEVTVARNQIVPLAAINVETETPNPDPDPKPELPESEWGLVGDINGWAAETPITMYSVDGYSVAYGVELTIEDGFKFVKNKSWENENVGGKAASEPDYQHATNTLADNNISVSVAGTYDIYLSAAADAYYIMTEGKLPSDAIVPEPTPEPQPNRWGLVGTFNDWDEAGTYYMDEIDNSLFAYYNVTLTTTDTFKIRYNNLWEINYGVSNNNGEGAQAINVGESTDVVMDATNMQVSADGAYDIYFDAVNEKILVVETGTTPLLWSVMGAFEGNNWASDIAAVKENGYYVAQDVVFASASAEFKVRRCYAWLGTPNTTAAEIHAEIAFNKNGNNIAVNVEQGVAYDIYIDATQYKVWVMTDGCKPGDAIPEPTPDPDPTPGDEASAGATTEQYERGEVVDPGWN